jgi:hypothetical protein
MQSINMFSTYGKLQLFFYTIPTSNNNESVWSLFGACLEPVENLLGTCWEPVGRIFLNCDRTCSNCELKPAHAFGVDSRKSFEVRFTIG